MATRTFTMKFLGEVADLQKKSRMAASSLESVQKAANSPGLTNSMARMSNMGASLQQAGGRVSSFGGTLSKAITAPALGAAAAVGGITAALGFKRLVGIDTARAQFKGLGYDADQVMKQVGEGVNNTALAMADGASLATGILATGAVPMDKLQESIKRVANVSAAYGVDASQAGNLLNKVLTKNKVTYGDLSQMQENGIPIISQLAKYYGVAGDEIMKMTEDGKISMEDFNKVIDQNSGKAAEEYGKSWQGVTANIKSNLGKIGAKVLGGAFETVKDKAAGLLELLRSDDLSGWADRAGTALGDFLTDVVGKVEKLVTWWKEASPWMRTAAVAFAGVALAIGPVLVVLGKFINFLGTAMIVIPKIVSVLGLISAPVAIWVVAIAAVVAGLVLFFTKTETGQAIVAKAWAGIQKAIAFVVEWWNTTAKPALLNGWEAIKAAAAVVSEWFTTVLVPAMGRVWEAVKESAKKAADWYNQHLAPVFQAFGELVRAIMENWVAPALSSIQEKMVLLQLGWQVAWQMIKQAWDIIGPPLIAYIKGAFEGLKIVLSTIWNGIKIVIETALGVIKGIITTVTALIKGDWAGAWQSIKDTNKVLIDGIVSGIKNVIGGVRDWLANVWTTIKNVAKTAWEGVRDSVMGVVDPLKDKITGAFDSVHTGIRLALDKVKGAAAKPINFVINTVWNNGLRRVINAIPGVPDVASIAPIPGYRDGDWTGPGPRDKIAGYVHADEYVFTKPEVNRMGGPGRIRAWKNQILDGGDMAGYKNGGRVHPVSSGIGTSYGGHTGRDFGSRSGVGQGSPVRAAGDGVISRTAKLATSYGWHIRQRLDEGLNAVYAHLSQIGVSAGQRVAAGQQIGRVGNTGNSFGAHLHFGINESDAATVAFLRGASVSSGGLAGGPITGQADANASLLLSLTDRMSGLFSSIKTGLTGPWGDLVRAGITDSVRKAKDWVIAKLTGSKTTGKFDKKPLAGYARGVMNAPRGAWWAGENGPEIVQGRGGESVIPAPRSMALAQQVVGLGSGTRPQQDVDALFERLIAAMESREAPTVTVALDEGDIRRVVRSEIRASGKV